MDKEFIYFLLGVAVAVPVGVITNLATPKIQDQIEHLSRISTMQKSREAQSELDEVTEYFNDRSKLYLKTISSASIAFIFYIIANALWAFPFFYLGSITGNYQLSEGFTAFATLLADIFFIIAIVIFMNHLKIISKIRSFPVYEREARDKIERLLNSRRRA